MAQEFEPNPWNRPFSSQTPEGDRTPSGGDIDGDSATWELLSLYIDGEATPEEAARVEALLRADPDYDRDLAFLRMAADSVRRQPELEPPTHLRDTIFAATSHRPTLARRAAAGWASLRQSLAFPAVRYGVPAGALAFAVLAAILLHSPHTVRPPQLAKSGSPDRTPPPVPSTAKPGTPDSPSKPSALAALLPGVGTEDLLRAAGVSRANTKTNTESPGDDSERTPAVQETRVADNTPNMVATSPERTANRLSPPKPQITPANFAPKVSSELSNPIKVANAGYTYQPNMDASFQHPARMEMDGGTLPGPEVRVSDAGTPSETTAPAPRPVITHRGHLILSQLPPSATLSNDQIKHLHEASTMGYDRETLESIKRGQATVSLIGSKF